MLTKENLSVFRTRLNSYADEGFGIALAFRFKYRAYVGYISACELAERVADDNDAERLLREHDGVRLRAIDVVDGSKNMTQFRLALALMRTAVEIPDNLNWEAVEILAADVFGDSGLLHEKTELGNDIDFRLGCVPFNAKGFGGTFDK